MKTHFTTYQSSTYQAYFAIDDGEYKQKVRFINRHKRTLAAMEFSEYMEIMDSYAEALFELGRYDKHIEVADHIIQLSIEENIHVLRGKDIYFETLFQKAASHYNLEQTEKAVHILRELLKMKPDHESGRLFLINCHVRQKSHLLGHIRKLSMILILAAAVFIFAELLFVRSFFPEIEPVLELVRNGLFISGTVILVAGELGVRYGAVSKMYEFIRAARKKK